MKPFYEGTHHSFIAISAQAETAVASLTDEDWDDFVVAADVFERSRASGRTSGRVVGETDQDGLFGLDTTGFGGRSQFICARRGREVLVAHVLSRRRKVGQKERRAAYDAVKAWRRANRRQRSSVDNS